ncbi:MAG: hypothetical protein RMJ56_16265 [Gemmataceae bacterium]|nr:hypothetical protein [Gemmata sp.]MDW8199152.1 hypothetical protein [Gemmataceae bacterium]
MYSVVLLVAATSGGDMASFGKKDSAGCYGGGYVAGCIGTSHTASAGCIGTSRGGCRGGGFLGLRDRKGCHGSSAGCIGSTSAGCVGTVVATPAAPTTPATPAVTTPAGCHGSVSYSHGCFGSSNGCRGGGFLGLRDGGGLFGKRKGCAGGCFGN